MSGLRPFPAFSRGLQGLGGVLAALSVALAAYASHGVEMAARGNLQTAAVFAFGHGIALAALAPGCTRRLGGAALVMIAAGVLLFSGSLALAHFAGVPTRFAPLGGSLMILGWLGFAADAIRR
ncbi:DUF423 domain-containing protein [Lysobacter sp. SG-8]|uniref:DUF423 domain-containing protein n=1 Tax=Marilutibacter penaei TaxID=2759900 RepID=A0A7W3U1S9_9GAMM|nr:DUF423 domain-containing protein [Lysobacter penaei]MBB1087339.1 DUF423 domain-containing protein [Lysobacter penaei]